MHTHTMAANAGFRFQMLPLLSFPLSLSVSSMNARCDCASPNEAIFFHFSSQFIDPVSYRRLCVFAPNTTASIVRITVAQTVRTYLLKAAIIFSKLARVAGKGRNHFFLGIRINCRDKMVCQSTKTNDDKITHFR